MAKKDQTLDALREIKRAILQGRDNAVTAISLMIKRVEEGGDLEPNPVVERAPRTPMAPMVTKAKPAPKPVKKAEPEVVAETTDEPSDKPDEKTDA